MKKYFVLVLTLIFVLSLSGCEKGKDIEHENSNLTNDGQESGIISIDEWETTVSYANWTEDDTVFAGGLNADKMYISSVQHLPIFKLDTEKDLEQFKKRFENVLSINQAYDEVPSFVDATSGYDEEFFETNSLLVVYVTANSGSLRFDVADVYSDTESVCVHIKQTNNPEVTTDDMAGWFVTVAVKDSDIQDCKSFDADVNNFEND